MATKEFAAANFVCLFRPFVCSCYCRCPSIFPFCMLTRKVKFAQMRARVSCLLLTFITRAASHKYGQFNWIELGRGMLVLTHTHTHRHTNNNRYENKWKWMQPIWQMFRIFYLVCEWNVESDRVCVFGFDVGSLRIFESLNSFHKSTTHKCKRRGLESCNC